MSTLRAQNWLNALTVGTQDSEAYVAICPIGDSSEQEVREELARLKFTTVDRNNQICLKGVGITQQTPAQILYSNPSCRQAVLDVLSEARLLASLGVSFDTWTFKAIVEAARQASAEGDSQKRLNILEASAALNAAWSNWVYYAGTLQEADDLWMEVEALALKEIQG